VPNVCEIWNGENAKDFTPSNDNHIYGALALYNGKPTAIGGYRSLVIETFLEKKWTTVAKLSRRFGLRFDKCISAVTLDSGAVLIFGGGRRFNEINKLEHNALTVVGRIPMVGFLNV